MMTHLFLHGGGTGTISERNRQFFQTLCSYGNNVLIFPFGLDEEEKGYAEYRERFIKNNPEKQLVVSYASRDTQELAQQIKDSDILFFSGGRPYKQFKVINKIENFKELIQDKVIAGTSGGAIMRAKAYYSGSAERYNTGNGLLPIKVIAHRGSNKFPGLPWEEREKLLESFGEKLPIYKIPEQEYIEFTI